MFSNYFFYAALVANSTRRQVGELPAMAVLAREALFASACASRDNGLPPDLRNIPRWVVQCCCILVLGAGWGGVGGGGGAKCA